MKLTEQVEQYKAFPREDTARNTEQMPLLIKEGRYPLSVAGLFERRLRASTSSDEEVRNNWLYSFFDTGDGAARRKDGRLKIVLDSGELRKINPNTRLENGAIPQSDETYLQQAGALLTEAEVEEYTGDGFSRQGAKDNKIWRILARHPNEVPKEIAQDPNLLSEYVDLVFTDGKFDNAMGLYVASPEDALRLWCVDWVGDRSDAYGYFHLGDGSGRLVGVREGTEGATPEIFNPLEARIRRAHQKGRPYEINGKVWAPVEGVKLLDQ